MSHFCIEEDLVEDARYTNYTNRQRLSFHWTLKTAVALLAALKFQDFGSTHQLYNPFSPSQGLGCPCLMTLLTWDQLAVEGLCKKEL